MKIIGRGNTLDYFVKVSVTKTKLFLTFEIMRRKVFGKFSPSFLFLAKIKTN